MMFWFHRYFIVANWRQLCELWMEFLNIRTQLRAKKASTRCSQCQQPHRRRKTQMTTMPLAIRETWNSFTFLHSLFSVVIKQGKINYLHFLNILIEYSTLKYFCWQTSYDLFYDDFLTHTHKKFICWVRGEKAQHIDNINCHHKCRRKSSLICFCCCHKCFWGTACFCPWLMFFIAKAASRCHRVSI